MQDVELRLLRLSAHNVLLDGLLIHLSLHVSSKMIPVITISALTKSSPGNLFVRHVFQDSLWIPMDLALETHFYPT